ncbi:MAG: 3-deoxy-8-phosphooctulonate synthase [Deltaproteobacteria bacterium]|nr:3-deoxy-8-phosphooctulonate synthase [Deltaproteobacteria bacterium]
MSERTVAVGSVVFGNARPFALIAGPCVIESRDSALWHAERIRDVARAAGVPYVFKASFDKANRTSGAGFRGPGMDEGLAILAEVRRDIGVPVLTDVHEASQVPAVAAVVDVMQTPAFLCRQTDFLVAVAAAGKPVNVKKGQFLSPPEMEHVIAKTGAGGNQRILVTERGASFGYNNLVADMRSLAIMARFGYPVIFDATHSVQLPGGAGAASGGQREFVPTLARAAVAVGVAGVFMEVHEDPDRARSDGPNSLRLDDLRPVLTTLVAIDRIVKGTPGAGAPR